AEIKSQGVEAVALDGKGDVFATVINDADPCGAVPKPCQHLVEYDSAGVEVADVGAGTFGKTGFPSATASAVAVNVSNGRVYVSDPVKERVWIYGPPAEPVVGNQLTAEVTTSEAKL